MVGHGSLKKKKMVGHGSLLAQQFICISDMLNVLVHWSAALGYMLII